MFVYVAVPFNYLLICYLLQSFDFLLIDHVIGKSNENESIRKYEMCDHFSEICIICLMLNCALFEILRSIPM